MQAIREIRNIDSGSITIDIPEAFWGQDVEIIILPLQVETLHQKKSLQGCLKHYANPDLIHKEKDAWQNTIGEMYEDR